jgi:hypothetical protein
LVSTKINDTIDDDRPRTIELTLDDRRVIGAWAADCAERVLPLFESEVTGDERPRKAIVGIRRFAAGGKRSAQLRDLAVAALAAAREARGEAASAAARSAGIAASTAYTKALAAPHHAKHALGPAVSAALARQLATAGEPCAGDEAIRWAVDRASTAVAEIVGRWPGRKPGRSRLDELFYKLDQGLREKAV